jgi:DNA-binding LacI/PurR family transcriptional regulator
MCRRYVNSENRSAGRRLRGDGLRVLNNSDTVKAKNRERVLQAIKESNYQPNLLARQLRTARSYMILVMVSNIANPFCAEVVKGIEEEAEKNGYRILLCNSGSDIERPARA